MGWTTEASEFQSRKGQELSPRRPDRSGVHPTSYPMGTVGPFSGSMADHSPPASAEVKKMRIYASTPPYAFMT
jgi:hypothetical protein